MGHEGLAVYGHDLIFGFEPPGSTGAFGEEFFDRQVFCAGGYFGVTTECAQGKPRYLCDSSATIRCWPGGFVASLALSAEQGVGYTGDQGEQDKGMNRSEHAPKLTEGAADLLSYAANIACRRRKSVGSLWGLMDASRRFS